MDWRLVKDNPSVTCLYTLLFALSFMGCQKQAKHDLLQITPTPQNAVSANTPAQANSNLNSKHSGKLTGKHSGKHSTKRSVEDSAHVSAVKSPQLHCKKSLSPPILNKHKIKSMLINSQKITPEMSEETTRNIISEYIKNKRSTYKACKPKKALHD